MFGSSKTIAFVGLKRAIACTAFAAFLVGPALAFDPATDHKCVAYCGGGSAPSSGGGYRAPAPSGPSPAEIARRRRHAEALRLDTRAHAAYDRGDRTEAARLFEQAARLAPNDTNIQGNRWYTKGLLAAYEDRNYELAISYYRHALRYFPHTKQVQADYWIAKAGLAHAQKNAEAVYRYYGEALRYTPKNSTTYYYIKERLADCACSPEDIKPKKESEELMRETEKATERMRKIGDRIKKREMGDALAKKGDWLQALQNYQQALEDDPDGAYAGLLKIKIAAAVKHLGEEPAKSASSANPNYPNPPPVYRDASTVRDYPDLASYTPAQHSAHNDNNAGNVWAQKGDWVQAMLSYQKALLEDPNGPFSKVIRENLDIATKHLKDAQQKAGTAPAAPVSPAPRTKAEAPKEVSASNCTGWMTANGKSSRLCMDAQAHRYCEEADGKGAVSRVSCQ